MMMFVGLFVGLRPGSYLQEAPVIVDKPDVVYVMENQSVVITITINHVNAAIIWKRYRFSSPLRSFHTRRPFEVLHVLHSRASITVLLCSSGEGTC